MRSGESFLIGLITGSLLAVVITKTFFPILDRQREKADRDRQVDIASEESFPASDSPGYR